MTDEFYSSAVPEQRFILGLPLRPLALGHIILLHRVKSAFVCEGNPDFQDLAISALICSLSYEGGLQAITDKETPAFLKLLGEKITGIRDWKVRFGFKKPRVIDLSANCEAFASYIAEHSKIPNYTYTPSDFKQVTCPPVQLVKVCLMRDMGFGESEILNRSWGLCLWDYVTLKALKGEVQMIEKEEIDNAQAVAQKLADMIKAGTLKVPGR